MAKKLGINVEIKYPDAKEIQRQLEEKWNTANKGDGYELGVRIKPSNLSEFRKEIQTYLKSEDIEVSVKANKKELTDLAEDFKSLKGEMNKELQLKFNYDTRKSITKVFEDIAQNAIGVNDSLSGIGNSISQFGNGQYSSAFGGVITSLQEMNDGSLKIVDTNVKLENSFKKTSEQYVDGELKSITTTEDKLSALRQIVDTQKEINSLNSAKAESSNASDIEAYANRIKDLTGYMDTLKGDYKEVFGSSPDSEWLVRNAESIGEMNIQLKESAKHQKEVESGYKRAVEILNEQESTQKRLHTAGEEEKEVILDKLKYLDQQYIANKENNNLYENMTSLQKDSLENIRQEQIFANEIAKSRKEDRENAKLQKEAYRELKTDLQDVYNIEKKIADLKAQEEYVTKDGTNKSLLSANETDKLKALEQQLQVRKDIYEQTKSNSNIDDSLVESLEKQHNAKKDILEQDAKIKAEIKEQKGYYDEIYDSIKRVDRLNDQMLTAGDREKSVIQKQVNLEEQKQQEIREQLKTLDLVNDAREEEISNIKRAQNEQNELNQELSEAKNIDTKNQRNRDGILGFNIDPMRMVSEARQAFDVILDSVETIDEQMVNIAKVTEAPQEELDKFAETLYDNASKVGLGADIYASGVERWVTAGFTLKDAVTNAELSSMGAFVGNIDEEAMVDYMSVPLNAFKKDGLEGADVLNIMNEVANKNAIEMDDLGLAYKTAAGTAANAGTSFAELTAMISSAQDATRLGGDVIGTAFKAIDINFGKMAAQLTDADVRKFDFFTEMGVSLHDGNGELRSTYDIIGDLAGRWETLNSEQQTTALFYAAGKSHSAVLQGLVGNWDGTAKAVGEANTQLALFDKTSGSAFQEFELQKDSVAFVKAEMSNAWAELLNTISGGKDGVNMVLRSVTDILKQATELAKNDTIMGFFKLLLGGTAWLTGATFVSQFFKTIGKGYSQTLAPLGTLLSSMTGIGGAAKKSSGGLKVLSEVAEDLVDTSDMTRVAYKALGSQTTKVGGAAVKASSMFGGLKLTMAKAIPVVGAVVSAVGLLEVGLRAVTGEGIIGNAKKLFDKISEGSNKSAEQVKELEKAQSDYEKTMSESKLMKGELSRVDDVIDKYKELKKSKDEASEDGVISYSKDEFEQFKTDIGNISELLGIDIPVTFNGQENIQAILDEVERALEDSKKKDSTELGVNLLARNDKLSEYASGDNLVDNKREDIIKSYDRQIADAINGGQEYLVQVIEKQKERALSNLERNKSEFLEESKEYQKLIELRTKSSQQQIEEYESWVEAAQNLRFDDMSELELEETSSMLLATAQHTKTIDRNYSSILDKISEGIELTDDEMGIVQSLSGEFASVDKNTGVWVDQLGEEAVNALIDTLNGAKEVAKEDENRTKEAIKNSLKRLGYNEKEIDEKIKLAYGERDTYVRLMGELGETGRLAMGVGQRTLDTYGEKWVDVLSNVQKQIDGLDDDVVTKYNLETEDGLVNAQVVETFLGDIPNLVKTVYKIENEDGSVNINNLLKLVSEIPEEKLVKFGIMDSYGNFDWEKYGMLFNLPEEIVTKYGLQKIDGTIDILEFEKLFEGLDSEYLVEVGADVDESGQVDMMEFIGFLNSLEDKNLLLEIIANSSAAEKTFDEIDERKKKYEEQFIINPSIEKGDYESGLAEIEEQTNSLLGKKMELGVGVDTTSFNEEYIKINKAREILEETPSVVRIDATSEKVKIAQAEVEESKRKIEEEAATVRMESDISRFNEGREAVQQGVAKINVTDATTMFGGDKTGFDTAYSQVEQKTKSPLSIVVSFVESISSGLSEWWNKFNRGISTSVRINGAEKLQSMAITPVLNRSFSQSIEDAVGQSIAQSATSYATSTSSYSRDYNRDNDREPTKTDTNVWRYWAKELFKGIPLENSMDSLERQIKKASDNQEKLIPLYKQQISLTDKQIAYNKELQKAQQSEMNDTLAALRKEGFKTSGNQITNLGYAKNISGEKADRVNPLLTTYKSLYESINGLSQTIADLNQDKFDLNQSIADAKETIRLDKIAKELEHIQKVIVKSEALLTAIENDIGIFTTKLGYIADNDYELKLSISEEGINKSIQSLKSLSNEFNRLSIMNISDSENAEEMKGHLETLKDSILTNADAILEYRAAIKTVEIDRFIADFEKLTGALETNISRVSNNVDNLREGLLSGQSLSSLESSKLIGVDFSRKSALEKQYQDRLNLEDRLNSALEGYANKNIERTAKVANATLKVEYNKYAELLKMAKDYSNGKVSTATISNPTVGIGSTSKSNTQDSKDYQAWQNQLASVNAKYEKAYASMVSKYDTAMSKAKTSTEKELINNKMIIDQLLLQEKIYNDLIKINNSAISKANEMLKDSSLTTEQREALLAQIEDYRQSNIDAQNSIKESVNSRFELEFELLDKVIEKSKTYSSELEEMLNIAEQVGASGDVLGKIYDAIYQGKINQFSQATDVIKQLTDEQNKLVSGSYEWNLLQTKIDEVREGMSGLTLEILEANSNILTSELDRIQKISERNTLGGKTLDGFNKFHDDWITGIEKELEIEKLRARLSLVEDKTLQSKIDLMDRQEALSKAEKDYLDKQLTVIELQEKLNNINGQRNVQTLSKDSEGNWQWQYVADQTAYDETKAELDEARAELEKYEREQRAAYAEEMNTIMDGIKNGEYDSESDIVEAIRNINELFDDILPEIKNGGLYDTDAVLEAYRNYIKNNQDIISGSTGDMKGYDVLVSNIGTQFEKSFLNISADFGKVLGEELRKALKSPTSSNSGSSYTIQNLVADFPNVKDADGLKEAFAELPQVVQQLVTRK